MSQVSSLSRTWVKIEVEGIVYVCTNNYCIKSV